MKLASALIAIVLVGCAMDMATPGAGDDDGPIPGDPGDGTGPVTEVSGRISANTTWKDVIHLVGDVTVDAGVTLTVAAGTTVDAELGHAIRVAGVLDVAGTRDSKVVFRSLTPSDFWAGVAVERGGTFHASYLVMTGGNLGIASTATVTLVDSRMSHAGGDLLVMSGGTLDMSYSQIGLEAGQRDTTHCDMHVSGPVNLTVTHSNLSTSAYGIMFYGGNNVIFTHNNWFSNAIDIDISPAYPVQGDFSDSYFAKGAPELPGVNVDGAVGARLADAGVR